MESTLVYSPEIECKNISKPKLHHLNSLLLGDRGVGTTALLTRYDQISFKFVDTSSGNLIKNT